MRLQAILALLCALTAAAAYHFTPHLMLADLQPVKLETMIPTQFGSWKMVPEGTDIISSPEQDEFIKSIYSQVLTRTYIDNAGNHIMLSIAYTRDQSDNSGTQSHKPEICYPAQGFSIRKSSQGIFNTDFGNISVRQLITEHIDRVEPLSYWTMVGSVTVQGNLETKLAQMSYGFRNIIADGLIFRVSMIDSDMAASYQIQQKFIAELVQKLSVESRTRLAGLKR